MPNLTYCATFHSCQDTAGKVVLVEVHGKNCDDSLAVTLLASRAGELTRSFFLRGNTDTNLLSEHFSRKAGYIVDDSSGWNQGILLLDGELLILLVRFGDIPVGEAIYQLQTNKGSLADPYPTLLPLHVNQVLLTFEVGSPLKRVPVPLGEKRNDDILPETEA